MKLIILLTVIACVHATAGGFAQTVTISLKNASLETIFKEIKKQTGYNFFYNYDWLERANKVSIDVKNAPLNQVLDLCFEGQPLTYEIVEKTISVKQRSLSNQPNEVDPSIVPIDIHGKVVDESGKPVPGVTVAIKGTKKATTTDENGEFTMNRAESNTVLNFTSINMQSFELSVNGKSDIEIKLKSKVTSLGDVTVEYSSGYQKISPERATGSFSVLDNKLITRSIYSNILNRIENLTPSLMFAHGDIPSNSSATGITIRGQSTIYGNSDPLIVLDNFPYYGNIDNINPNDIENITILKDASASSIWGATAGNGVIVITTKKGQTKRPQISLNTSVTIQGKPNLFNVNTISSADYIDLEQSLYGKGYYAGYFNGNPYFPAVTPVVQLLNDVDSGIVSSTVAQQQINAMKTQDVRNDETKYFYRQGVNQQYSLNVSGASQNINYFMSAGWDHDLGNMVSYQTNRITLRSINTIKISKNLFVDAGINYVQGINQNGNNPGQNYIGANVSTFYPYAKLVNNNGAPLPINFSYNNNFLQTSQNVGLLNWQYYPVADINREENKVKTRDYTANIAFRYKIIPSLNAEIKYQYENQLVDGTNLYSDSSYYARNLVNIYTQVIGNGILSFPIPIGGIIYYQNSELVSHQGRAQLNFTQSWGSKNLLTAIAGTEIKSTVTTGNSNVEYGYEPNSYTVQSLINYNINYPFYGNLGNGSIPVVQNISKTTDHFLSYYSNAAYTYNNKYILSGSVRYDEANLFGVETNEKGAPLYSFGGAWLVTNESFYHFSWIDYLKIRATYGYQGNISRLTSAYQTQTYGTAVNVPVVDASIKNLSNRNLRWERTAQFNTGIDFISKNKIISGSIDYYQKNVKDLMGQAPIDPTYGLINYSGPGFFYGNVAGMKVNGTDLELNSRNLDGRLKWYTTFLFSYTSSKVTRYLMPVNSSGSTYLNASSSINPIVGKPLYAYYSYPYAGLDPSTGNPLGYYQGKVSNDYASMATNIPLDSLVYNGSAQPVYFGAFRNTISYEGFSLSCNISYKLGYYFRKHSYDGGLPTSWTLNGDYAKRWKQPGDEKQTNIPSLLYPADPNREQFYDYSSILVERADNIRLEDISISYDKDRSKSSTLPFSHFRLYAYMANLGVIWVANKDKIDPYYNNILKPGKSISFGLTVNF
ncbi:MAG TPA: SusC/RagA family TonB-linked outer membrane protein [Puia sp.]|nr:SusC/RagA family TonB-linked outer membrane protein [Puia sp.]